MDREPAAGEHDIIMVHPSSSDPGDNGQYTITFEAAEGLDPGTDDIEIKMEDFGVPDSISTSRITMRIAREAVADDGIFVNVMDTRATNPEAVIVDGEKITLTVPDFSDGSTDSSETGIMADDQVTIIFRQSAGISNPTEEGLNPPERPYPIKVDGFPADKDDSKDNSVEVPDHHWH